MKILDKYIVRSYLSTFVFMIFIFMIIAVVIDVAEHLGKFIKGGASMKEIVVDYYLNFCLFFGNVLSSLLVLLSVLWVTSRMAQRTEIIAILNGGVTFKRLLLPFLAAGGVLVAASLVIGHFLLPLANKTKYDFQEKYIWGDFNVDGQNHHREIEEGTIVYFRTLRVVDNIGYSFSLEKWREDKSLAERWTASRAQYIDSLETWRLYNFVQRKFENDSIQFVTKPTIKDTTINMLISDFGERHETAFTMTSPRLAEHIRKKKLRGSAKTIQDELELYSRNSNAVAILIFTLIAFSISSRKMRGGTGIHILTAIIIGLIYVFALRIAGVSATNSGVPPSIAVWIPNIVFAVVGLFAYRLAPK